MYQAALFTLLFFGICGTASAEPLLLDVPFRETRNSRVDWIVAFVADVGFRARLVNRSILAGSDSEHQRYCPEHEIFLSGGFLDKQGRPEGLLIENGQTVVDYASHYTSGGVMYSLRGNIGFLPLSELPPSGSEYALQSKPFLWEDKSVAAGRVPDSRWDRVAVGTAILNQQSGMIVIGAFAEDRKALRQHQFINSISRIERSNGLEIEWLVNLDGANTAFVNIPSMDIFHGLDTPRYIPSALCVGTASKRSDN